MTDRKPDFYRVVRDVREVRHYWGRTPSMPLGECTWLQARVHAFLFSILDVAGAVQMMYPDARIVPVYVKVTRKPKLHDFAWALRRMREGKRVRRVGWSSYEYIWLADAALNRLAWNSDCAATVGNEALFATDWQLYEAP